MTFIDQHPRIRSSDFSTARSNPFLYFLSRRLGINSPFSQSEALTRGTWFHEAVANISQPRADFDAILASKLLDRSAELEAMCLRFGKNEEKILESEREDWDHAVAWALAASEIKFGHLSQNFINYFSFRGWKSLGHEVLITIPGTYGKTPLVAQIDDLLYHEEKKQIAILDYKTTKDTPRERLATCPWEHQTLHYLYVTRRALPLIRETFDLPPISLSGMYHCAIQKPTIKMCGKDRNFREYDHELKSGPRKGLVEKRREYLGEPIRKNYVKRCVDWMKGVGDHVDRRDVVSLEPCVNISHTPLSEVLHEPQKGWYISNLRYLQRMSNGNLDPRRFPPGKSLYLSSSPYLPFYALTPEYWDSILQQEGFIIRDRDENSPEPPSIVILG